MRIALPGERRLTLHECLHIGAQLAGALAELHEHGLIHGEFRPNHILYDADTREVCLRGPGSKPVSSGELPGNLGRLSAKDLAYISPEQTGRMNCSVDYRTDFYSLGVLLYRILTGRLPFDATDPLELVHSHIARLPRPPADVDVSIPPTVSNIVMMLLQKPTEDRYQNSRGLRFDLEECLARLESTGQIVPFALGARDVSNRLKIPRKLYGREREAAELLAAFEQVAGSGQPMLVLVSGYSGIGKSALVQSLQQPVAHLGGWFVTGKVDQYQRDTPYAAIAQAFRGLIRKLLIKPEARIIEWRRRLESALNGSGHLIVDVIPEIELIIGAQPLLPSLPPAQAQNRFHRVFRRFIEVFARSEHPFMIFLDDLQWLDASTLKLMEEVITHPDTRHLLLIGAYRDNEIGPTHPLTATLERIDRSGTKVHTIVLEPPEQKHLNQLLADALHCNLDQSAPLARLLSEKTQDNPLFFIQFLTELYNERFLIFSSRKCAWTWDLAVIRAKNFSDNVVELMVGKLKRLPAASRKAMQIASCLGNAYDVETLALVNDRPLEDMVADLRPAVFEGLVACRDRRCRFLHDRIQEATYSLIPEEARAAMHLGIGRSLLQHYSAAALAEHVFDVVNQFNRGIELVSDIKERERLFELNVMAGSKAKAGIAYASARSYLLQAVALLPYDPWSARYEDTFSLHLDLSECEYFIGNFDEAEELFNQLADRARSDLDYAKVCVQCMKLYQVTGRFEYVLNIALDAMHRLGVTIPDIEQEVQAATEAELREIQINLGSRRIADIANAPPVAAPNIAMLIILLVEVSAAAYMVRPAIYRLIVAKSVNLSLSHGNHQASCHGYSAYASMLVHEFHNIPSAFEFSEMAVRLSEKLDGRIWTGQIFSNHAAMVIPWRRHLANSFPLLDRAFLSCLEVGDMVFAGYISCQIAWHMLEKGNSLDDMLNVSEKHLAFAKQSRNRAVHATIRLEQQFVANLKGSTHGPQSFDDDTFDEAEAFSVLTETTFSVGIAYYHVMKQVAAFTYCLYDQALVSAQHGRAMAAQMHAIPVLNTHCFYFALTLTSLFPTSPPAKQVEFAQILAELLEKLKFRADSCPENWLNRYALVAAEAARIENRDLDAMRLYEQAIRSAHENGFVQNEALACELASNFYRVRDFEVFANIYLIRARACYARWGATGKVKQLEALHLQLKVMSPSNLPLQEGAPLDALAVIKASQAVSREVVFDQLLATLMRTMVEVAGAERGYLLLAHQEKLWIAAEASVMGDQTEVRLCEESPDHRLPVSVLNYARRSAERVILDDARVPNTFSADDYFIHGRSKSVLCLPILRQTELIGLLYLENNLFPHAFTSERLAVLELLAAQAAISLTNARLYHELHEAEARLRRLVEANIIGIIITDYDGHVIEANDAFLRLIGYERKDLIEGRINWKAITPSEYLKVSEQAVEDMRVRGACTPFEKEFIRRDGCRVPALVGAANLDDSGKRAVAFALDLTEHRRADTERLARECAEAANQAKSEFLANMSHELRSPLNTILGFARLTARDPSLPEGVHEDLNLIVKSGEHLHTLINEVLDLSKLEAGRASVNEIDFRLDLLLDELKDIFGPISANKGVRLIFDPQPKATCHIRADAVKLRQILINLIDNAIKFTREGSVTVVVRERPSAELESDWQLEFAVTDTGPGIAPNETERLFDAFVQAEAGAQSGKGTGLGLTISRQFVRLMGGELWIESERGKGTSVCFEIPVHVLKTDQQPEAPTCRVVGLQPDQPHYRLLIVDDLPEARQLLARVLFPLGFELKEARDGLEAIELWRRWRPHLIWMDQHMPVLDGREATYRIKASSEGRDTVIIALTASSFEEERQDVLAAGCDDFLRKPFLENDLFALLEKHLQVRFVYKEEAPVSTAVLDANVLAALPKTTQASLEQALIHLDVDAIDALIETIGGLEPSAALALTAMAKNFEYEKLLGLLQQAR